jgi:hypothetical protein
VKAGTRVGYWALGLFVVTVVCCIGWVFGSTSWRDEIVVVGGLAAIASGVLTFANLGGAGSAWASAQLRWQRRLPFYAASADRTDPRHVYRLLGSITIALGAVLVAVGIVGILAAR